MLPNDDEVLNYIDIVRKLLITLITASRTKKYVLYWCYFVLLAVLGTYLIGVGRVFENEKEREKERNFLINNEGSIRQLFFYSKCLFLRETLTRLNQKPTGSPQHTLCCFRY